MTLSRKGAKSLTRVPSLRSTGTKASTDVDRPLASNADLEKKLAEALEQQAATSEVLRAISSSPGDLKPVFETMLANAIRLCEAKFGSLFLREGEDFRNVCNISERSGYTEWYQREPMIVLRDHHPRMPLARVAFRCLAKDREGRYCTTTELAAELEAISLRGLGSSCRCRGRRRENGLERPAAR